MSPTSTTTPAAGAAGTVSPTGARLAALRAEGRAALVGYLPVGFPDVERSVEAVLAMVDAGVDVVEIGVPYTDPVMDGPVVQAAAEAALAGGARVRDVLRVVEAVAEHSGGRVPSLVMTYWNPVLRHGVDAFARDLATAGAAGLITPDLIPDEGADWLAASDAHGLDRVFLVAPSSTTERLRLTARASRGFVYAASTMGVTGVRAQVGEGAERLVADTRAAGAEHVCVGLGVSTGDQAAQVGRYADGVIVGSALVRTLLADAPWAARLDALQTLTADLADGVRRARLDAGAVPASTHPAVPATTHPETSP
ncbi:tryptophan synthase subunit alpha [Isoptericola hypogeus]|uniref:Tryptophan synthase alpha chain n=1 Tax=Isoptericola hypogeus TaxID=300179 RepID=A0ABN2JPK3_9MICO